MPFVKASEVLKAPPKLKPLRKPGEAPAGASELTLRRHADVVAALQRAIEQREQAFNKLARANAKVWDLGRQLKRYEDRITMITRKR